MNTAMREPPLFTPAVMNPSSVFSVNAEGKQLTKCRECNGSGGWLICRKEKKWTTKKGTEKSCMVERKVAHRQYGIMLYHKYECTTAICPTCKGAGLEIEK